MEGLWELGRIIAGAYYDYQAVRTASMNRIRDLIRTKVENIDKSKPEEKKEKKEFYKKYADEDLPSYLDKLLAEKKLTEEEHSYIEKFLKISINALKLEQEYKQLMLQYVETEPIYARFLKHIRGIGPVISAMMLKNFGYCERFDKVSALWKICGLHVVDGKAPKRKKNQKIDYSPKLRAFVWNIGACLLRSKNPFYYPLFKKFREIEESKEFAKGELYEKYGKPYTKEDTKLRPLHTYNRAKRKIEKIFLQHYWACARELKGLPVTKPYPIEKLKHVDYYSWKEALKVNLEAEGKGTIIEPSKM